MTQHGPPRLILASQSEIRLALLRTAGLAVEAVPAHVDEAAIKAASRAEGAAASETALLLAEMKADRIARRAPDAVVIAADQILVGDERWFDKPDSVEAARVQLRALRGQTHRLVTTVVCQRDDVVLWRHVAEPRLTMRNFTEAFLDSYLASEGEAVLSSVGAYRLEGLGVQLFDRIEGDFFSVLGLPLLPLLGFLRQNGALPA